MGKHLHLLITILLALWTLIPYKDVTCIFPEERERSETKYIIVHHDAIPHETTIANIDYQHRVINGWGSGFAYAFNLKDGLIYQVKGANKFTANAINFNHNSVAVCVHGDFDVEEPSTIQLSELYVLLKILKFRYPDAEIVTHGELNTTSCCGMNLKKNIDKWTKGNQD